MSYGYSSLLPKREINADIFANDNKKWNGNLTRIAIWDTGVDPTAAGLQITPDGKPKIVDMIDASGSGDVKMKCKRHVDQVNRTIETLTGRKVEIPNHWNPPDGIIRIGVKLASELFPKLLMQRLRNENRDNFWRPSIKRLAANLACDLTEAEEYLSDITQNINRISISSSDKDSPRKFVENDSSKTLHDDILCTDQKTDPISCQMNSNFSSHQVKREKREQFGLTPTAAKAQLKAAARSLEDSLSLLDQRYSPMEILYDCFVFHNGSEWVACVDTSPYNPGKKLSDLPLLRDYTVNHEYASFGEQTQLYYTVKIFDNGKLLQIVTNNSSHGTHVAAIASAYFPACSSKHPSKHSPRKQPTDVFASANKTITDAAKSISHFCDRNGVAQVHRL
uniref:Peptidase_S8 domain-containing protein n=1 Tax=Trichobilharzia regenti TaxID=157069 RepID=A0AA85J459_TRIRE|nr:unnamed protein product [Trichobilharzia regenti]